MPSPFRNDEPTARTRSKPTNDGLSTQQQRKVQQCEPRLALSASLSADFLLSAIDSADVDDSTDIDPTDGDWLLRQAAAVRETFGLDGAGQSIAVIDSGIAWDHIALGGGYGPGYRVVGGWDFAENDADPYDDGPAGFHGTHVSGLLAGQSNDFSGIAPGADLVALRVFNDQGQGSLDSIENALQWVHANRTTFASPITTVNLSLGAILNDANASQVMGQLEDELQLLHDEGIVVVAAAGNQFDPQHPDRVTYPAASQWVTAVGSIDSDGRLSDFSQRESELLAAPGRQVRSTVPDHVLGWDGNVDDFVTTNGTSMAAPQLAGATALVREAMLHVDPNADVQPDTILQHLRDTSRSATDPQTGLTYHVVDLQAAINDLLTSERDSAVIDQANENSPAYDHLPQSIDPSAFVDVLELGSVESQTNILQPDQWYAVQASRTGLFSISGLDRTDFEMVDSAGNPLEPLEAAFAQQHDYAVNALETRFLRLVGTSSASVRLSNVVGMENGEWNISGTGAADTVNLNLEDGVRIDVNGAKYLIESGGQPAVIHLDGRGGSDALTITGSTAAERLVVRAANLVSIDTSTFESRSVSLDFNGFETVNFQGGGGADLASIHDTAGNDQLSARPQSAKLTGSGFAFEVTEVPRIYVHATNGGEDKAFLYDSPGDDTLAIRPQFTSLRNQTDFNLAYGFERVYAFASGGDDTAQLYDSAGNDHFSASIASATLSGPGYFASARSFESVEANATAGGNDIAQLHGNEQARWQSADGLVQFSSANADQDPVLRIARGFSDPLRYIDNEPILVQTQSLDHDAMLGQPADTPTTSATASTATPLVVATGPIVTTGLKEANILASLFRDLGLEDDDDWSIDRHELR